MQQRYRSEGIVTLSSAALEQPIVQLAGAYERRASDASLIALARAAVATLTGAIPEPTNPMTHVLRAQLSLSANGLAIRVALSAMATAAHLSPDRFRHLFMEETGVGFRAYVLWRRLEYSLAAYVAGDTLTRAAHTGGFADSAHFSRTFRKMFGIAPASVQPE